MKRWMALLATVAILAFLFLRIDRIELLRNLAATRMVWFAAALAMFVPQLWAITVRWKRMVDVFTPITWAESFGLIISSNTINLLLPSKLGDLAKGVFLTRMGALDLKRAMNVVVFEKMLDVAALALFMLGGVALLLFTPGVAPAGPGPLLVAAALGAIAVTGVAVLYFVPLDALPGMRCLMRFLSSRRRLAPIASLLEAAHEVTRMLRSRGARPGLIVGITLLIWVFHLVQIWFFFLALDVRVPPGQFASLVPLAIFVGLIPVTVAGFGTRDGALQAFFPQYPPEQMLAVAMFVNLRYILPAIMGIPWALRYIGYAREAREARIAGRAATSEATPPPAAQA